MECSSYPIYSSSSERRCRWRWRFWSYSSWDFSGGEDSHWARTCTIENGGKTPDRHEWQVDAHLGQSYGYGPQGWPDCITELAKRSWGLQKDELLLRADDLAATKDWPLALCQCHGWVWLRWRIRSRQRSNPRPRYHPGTSHRRWLPISHPGEVGHSYPGLLAWHQSRSGSASRSTFTWQINR